MPLMKKNLYTINKRRYTMRDDSNFVELPKKAFWKLSIPIIAFCFFDAIYGIVDLAWVSQINVHAFFAVGVSIPLVSLIFSFGDSLGQGTNSMMSRFMGVGDNESAYNTVIHGIILANIIWVGIVLCTLFAQGVLFTVDEADSYILVWDYLIPIVTFAYVFILVNFFAETMQAEGNSTIPSTLIIVSNILNIVLDPIFIFTFNLGVKGAAYATVFSSLLVLIGILSLYLSGRTKVPLSFKYFKFRPYIFIEIIKVAIPNFLDSGLWAFSASFVNGILIGSIGEIGPILYSVSNKLRNLLSSPTKGYGRALMSVTGHLFGAHKLDELNEMLMYTIKVALLTTAPIMVIFVIFREQVFGLFSITGRGTEIFWIALFGCVIMFCVPIIKMTSKMLDGLGKSLYALSFTIAEIVLQVGIISVLNNYLPNGSSVLVGITSTQVIFAIVYYVFLQYMFKNFDKKFENETTVKTFNEDNEENHLKQDTHKEKNSNKNSILSKLILIIALISMIVIVVEILLIPVSLNDYPTLICAIIALAICTISVYLLAKLHKPRLSLLGFIVSAVILFSFMHIYGNVSILLFVVAEIIIVFIILILTKLTS